MPNGFAQYVAIKQLLDKYNLVFQDGKDYDAYIKDLLEILDI